MSLKTCRYCNNKYEDSWGNWVSKYCCRKCYYSKKHLYNINSEVYTYSNKKLPNKTMDAITSKGVIINIHEVYRPTQNGLWQYVIKLSNNKIVYRFEHQIFITELECEKFVTVTNERRKIMRSANNLLKDL